MTVLSICSNNKLEKDGGGHLFYWHNGNKSQNKLVCWDVRRFSTRTNCLPIRLTDVDMHYFRERKKTLKNIWLHRNQNRNDLCRIKQLQRKRAEQMAIPLRFNEASTSCSNTFSIHESVYMHLTEESKRNFTRNCVQTQQAGHINNNTKTRFYM